MAHKNEFDLDSPDAIDFDLLVKSLKDLKRGSVSLWVMQMARSDILHRQSRRADIPVYSFRDHQRLDATTPIYSPHVLILEGIFALYDPRVLELLDMRIFAEADADLCLARRSEAETPDFL